jgi:hypothetical protein
MKLQHAALVAVIGLGLAVSACEKKEETPMEKLGDAVGDATNTRENENLKDAGEDAADAVENAGEAVKEAVGGEGN